MKKEIIYECFKCRNKHSTENVSPTCAKCVYDQVFALQKTILEQGRMIDGLKAEIPRSIIRRLESQTRPSGELRG